VSNAARRDAAFAECSRTFTTGCQGFLVTRSPRATSKSHSHGCRLLHSKLRTSAVCAFLNVTFTTCALWRFGSIVTGTPIAVASARKTSVTVASWTAKERRGGSEALGALGSGVTCSPPLPTPQMHNALSQMAFSALLSFTFAYAINLGASAVTTASKSTTVMNPAGPFGNTRLVNRPSVCARPFRSRLGFRWSDCRGRAGWLVAMASPPYAVRLGGMGNGVRQKSAVSFGHLGGSACGILFLPLNSSSVSRMLGLAAYSKPFQPLYLSLNPGMTTSASPSPDVPAA